MNVYHPLIDGPAEPIGLSMDADGFIPEDDILQLKLPGDPGWPEHVYELRKRQAQTLAERGWQFIEKQGPRGHYYDAFNPRGEWVMTEQKPDKKAAFIAAIDHAFARQFPTR